MKSTEDRDLKCLPLYGDTSMQRRLLAGPRLLLEVQGSYTRRVLKDDAARLDPVLRSHMRLDETETTAIRNAKARL